MGLLSRLRANRRSQTMSRAASVEDPGGGPDSPAGMPLRARSWDQSSTTHRRTLGPQYIARAEQPSEEAWGREEAQYREKNEKPAAPRSAET